MIALEDILVNPNFVQTHRAYIINMKHVRKMNKKFFLMTKSYEIPISNSHLEELTNIYMKYVLGEES
jgi:DNA-binding LytR/AlgR family response regulator